jgi:pyruvate dehydrogenase E1 component
MFERCEDVFYYITVANENYQQPSLPPNVAAGVIAGMYCYSKSPKPVVRLLGSGSILREVIAAANLLASDWNIQADVWSVTSFTELAREAREVSRTNRLHLSRPPETSYVGKCLSGPVPIVAATDYVSAYAGLIAAFVDSPFLALGTDGFGRSDIRSALRRHFEVDRQHITLGALQMLVQQGLIDGSNAAAAVKQYGLEADLTAPWGR